MAKIIQLPDQGIEANEDAIATAFAVKYCNDLQYCHDWGVWLVWDQTRWIRERKRLAFNYARALARDANKKGEKSTAKAATASGAERFAQADPRMAMVSDELDLNPWLLGTPTGTVDLKTGHLNPPDRRDRITKLASVGPAGDCPTWLAFLDQATGGDAEQIDYLQRVCGYCLTGSVKEHALFFFYGDGGNGKGTFINTATDIMGDYAITAAMETFTASKDSKHPTELAHLRGARIVTAQETEEGRHWAEVKIKALTGGDPITARYMHKDYFTFYPNFKLMFAGNHKPALKTVDAAVRRRFHIIPFINTPETPDPELGEKLRAEGPGIMAWMIEGCLHWQKIGLSPPPVVRAATEEYFDDQNTFQQWLKECCDIGAKEKDTSTNLYTSWKRWSIVNGEEPGTAKSFSQHLQREGFVKIRTKKAKIFNGLCVSPVDTAGQWQNRFEDQR